MLNRFCITDSCTVEPVPNCFYITDSYTIEPGPNRFCKTDSCTIEPMLNRSGIIISCTIEPALNCGVPNRYSARLFSCTISPCPIGRAESTPCKIVPYLFDAIPCELTKLEDPTTAASAILADVGDLTVVNPEINASKTWSAKNRNFKRTPSWRLDPDGRAPIEKQIKVELPVWIVKKNSNKNNFQLAPRLSSYLKSKQTVTNMEII